MREISAAYPEITEALAALAAGRSVILDGELIAPDPSTGVPVFGRLQRRMHLTRPSAALVAAVRVEYMVFDVLAFGDESVMDRPYLTRRGLLEKLGLDRVPVRVPPFWRLTEVSADRLLQVAQDAGLEGIVSKHVDSVYEPGRRSSRWIKTPLRRTTDAVVVGWTFSEDQAPTRGPSARWS